jgi:hypothetical protein
MIAALVAPWAVAAALLWRGPDKDTPPASLADAARRRLWSS